MEKKSITSKQCKAARDLLGWKQDNLSKIAGLGITTIREFESKNRKLTTRTLRDIKTTFEEAGITFINEDGEIGVKLKSS